MKKISLLAFLCLSITFAAFAQRDFKTTVPNSKSGSVVLTNFSGDLTIEGYNGNEIIVTAKNLNKHIPEKAKGMQAIYPGGIDNTGVGISLDKSDNKVTLQCLLSISNSSNYNIKIPNSLNIKVDKDCSRVGSVSVSNMHGELEIKNCYGIKLRNISGPVVLSAIAGDIDLVYDNMPKGNIISLNSVSGDIDITMPERAAVDLQMQNLNGQIYSDFDLHGEKKSLKQIGGNNITATLNGGGTKMKITNVSGSIYLRKKK